MGRKGNEKVLCSDEKQTSIVMQGENRKEWINYCYEHYCLHVVFMVKQFLIVLIICINFLMDILGLLQPGDISAESWKLLGRAASVFSLAYSRFKDLTQARIDLIKLKEEKKRAEDALS